MRQRLGAIILFILAVTAVAGGVWWFAFTAALVPLEERGRVDLSLASDRLVGELQRYRQVAVLLADHPVLLSLANGGVEPKAHALLLETADKTGSLEILFANAEGHILASSQGAGTRETDIANTAVFARAMTGALGTDHKRLEDSSQRVFYFSAPVLDGGAPLGAVVVKVDIEAVEESDWRGGPQAIYFTDEAGIIFVSNRSELLFRHRNLAPFENNNQESFLRFTSRSIGQHEIWMLSGGPYFPKRALHLTQPIPVIGMTGEVLISTAPAERSALQQVLVAVALCLVFGALLYVATERRRSLDERLQVEAEAKALLERRVESRTRALSSLNLNLRDQIAVREEAEAALKQAQAELVQAGKLTALGEMSAGISHELNQPLMAIRSFAENAEVFLERGKTDIAAQNMSKISELSRRMGRIIKNLRAFARQEDEPISNVNLTAVIDAVLDMSEARLAREGVRVKWNAPKQEVYVRGGEVRLQQVLTNLLSNAVDAMDGYDEKRVDIWLDTTPDSHRLHLRDRGPGIKAPEKIFDPFYSTKKVGSAEGMGLGLSISYGLIQSFGGNIRGRNHPEGGAEFIVELAAAKEAAA